MGQALGVKGPLCKADVWKRCLVDSTNAKGHARTAWQNHKIIVGRCAASWADALGLQGSFVPLTPTRATRPVEVASCKAVMTGLVKLIKTQPVLNRRYKPVVAIDMALAKAIVTAACNGSCDAVHGNAVGLPPFKPLKNANPLPGCPAKVQHPRGHRERDVD